MGEPHRHRARRARQRRVSVARTRAALAAGGFTLDAPLTAGDYDALVPEPWRCASVFPGTRNVLVVANAGRTLWPLFLASPESRLEHDPLDGYTRRVFAEASGDDAGFALYMDRRDEHYLPLVPLAQRAGLGTPGRVGVLLHPVYGPWMSLRGVVFTSECIEPPAVESFDPCTGCPAPCQSACHGRVIAKDGVDVDGCYRTRLTNPECALRCDARRACVVGPEHAFSPEQEAHHASIRQPARRPDR